LIEQGNLDAALNDLDSIESRLGTDPSPLIVEVKNQKARLLLNRGQSQRALDIFLSEVIPHQQAHNLEGMLVTQCMVAHALLRLVRYGDALALLKDKVLPACGSEGMQRTRARALGTMAEAFFLMGRTGEALMIHRGQE